MENADAWVLAELRGLQFAPYPDSLSSVTESMAKLREIEKKFTELVGETLSKRQAVAFGLLARTFQLSISCLVNQLLQDYAGWNCSYRSLLETFFVVDWINEEPQRFEAYFEGTTPVIGRIKAECCGRYPKYAEIYDRVSKVTHVGNRALHLSPKRRIESTNEIPFSATTMSIAGKELSIMLDEFAELAQRLQTGLEDLLIEGFKLTKHGETLWDKGTTKSRFGCLGWEPRYSDLRD